MDRFGPLLQRNASAQAILPIGGLLTGLLLGAIWANFLRMDEITSVIHTLRFGVTGFFLGLSLILLIAFNVKGRDIVSLRRMMVLVAIAGFLSWYSARILFQVIGY